MINMIITPMMSGQSIHPDVINGVACQNINWKWLIHTSPPCISNQNIAREVNININRQQLKDLLYKYPLTDDSYILLLDSDVVMQPNCVNAMIDHLNKDSTLICSACRTKTYVDNQSKHIITACALIRWKIYRTYIHLYENMSKCQCSRIASYGKVEYVPNIQLYEIDN